MEGCFSHEIKNDRAIYYNAGANWQDLNKKPTYNVLLGFSAPINEKFIYFIEAYYFKKPLVKNNFVMDAGIALQLNKKLQLDFATGLDITLPKGNYYFDGGVSYNF